MTDLAQKSSTTPPHPAPVSHPAPPMNLKARGSSAVSMKENKMQQVVEKFQKIEMKYGISMSGTERRASGQERVVLGQRDTNVIRDQIDASNPT